MVAAYNTNASNQGLHADEMSAATGNLLDPRDPSPAEFKGEEWFHFDLAVVGLGFHHFEDPTLAATRLAERLKPGGVLMILDFLPHDPEKTNSTVTAGNGEGASSERGHSHGHSHGHDHHASGHDHHASGHGHSEESKEPWKKVMGTVAHHGFGQEQVKEAFEKAGVGKDFGFDVIAQNVVFIFHERRMTRTIFMAKGKKA
jgi:SAM-dependent methyltransferase